MRFAEYFKLTRVTTNFCFLVCGILFSAIFLALAIVAEYKTMTLVGALQYLVICFLLGNAMGGFLWGLAIMGGYRQTRGTVRVFNSIPERIRNRFGLELSPIYKDSRYNFMQMNIATQERRVPFFVHYQNGLKSVILTLGKGPVGTAELQKHAENIHMKYKTPKMEVSDTSLTLTLKIKDWKHLSNEVLEALIIDFCAIREKGT